MATLVQDSFNRADGAVGTADVGGAWADGSVAGAIASNKLHLDADESCHINMTSGNFDATWTWDFTSTTQSRAIFRCTSTGSPPEGIRLQPDALRYEDGPSVPTLVKTFASPIATGSVVRVQASRGRVRVWDDGSLIADCGIWIEPTQTYMRCRQTAGLNSSDWDSLLVTDVVDTPNGDITHRSTSALVVAASSPLVLNAPSGATVGDYMVAVVGSRKPTLDPTMSGWTLLGSQTTDAGGGKLWAFGRRWAGADPVTLTAIGSVAEGWAGFIAAFVDVPTDWVPSVSTTSAAASETWASPSVSVVGSGMAVTVVMTQDDNELALVDAAGWYLIAGGYDYDTASGDDFALGMAVQSGSGSIGGPTWLQSVNGNDSWAGLTFAFTPSQVPAGVSDALIEVDVTNDPRSGVTTWTDITAYARGTIDIVRGRQDEQSDQLAPATCSLTLDNSDGRFTPDLTTGTYYPRFRKGIQVRISVDLDGTTYRRFRGYVDTVDGPTWPGGVTQQSFVQLTCSDELAQWSKGRKFKDVLTETILRDSPDAYYPLTNGELVDESGNNQKRLTMESRNGGGSITVRDGINDREAGILANIGDRRDIDRESDASRNWRGGSFRFKQGAQWGHRYLERALTIPTASLWAISCWARLSREDDANGGWLVYLKNGSRYLGLGYNSVGAARASSYDATTVTNATGHRLTNNEWKHCFVYYNRAGNVELWVNGKQIATAAAQNWDNSAADPTLWIGSGLYAGASTHYGIQRGNLAHVAIYTGANATAALSHVDDFYEAGWNGFSDARTGEMMDRIVGWMQFPGVTAVDRGDSTVGDRFANGSTALEYAQLLIDSEAGSLYTTGDGTLTFHARSFRYNNSAAALTISSNHDTDTGFRTDDQYLVNRARYNLPNGGRGADTAKASVSSYGPYERVVETLLRSESAADLLAEFAVFKWKNPDGRLLSFPVDILTRPTSLGVDALAVEIDDRITMTNLPSQAPAASVTGYVEGYSETIGTPEQAVWQITFNTSPTYTISDYFILNSATQGQLNTDKLYY